MRSPSRWPTPTPRVISWLAVASLVVGCAEDTDDELPEEMELSPEDEASEGKTGEAAYQPTNFCLEGGPIPNGPNLGPAALGDLVVGTSGRADEFGNESWGAGYGAELSLQGISGGPHGAETVIRGELVGSAIVFDLAADVVRIGLDGKSTADGMTGFDADLTILDRWSFPLLSYEGDFSDEQHFSAPLFTATTGVPLVPGLAPVEVEASAVGQLGYLVSGQILPRGIAILVRPQASVLVTAQANVGAAGVASARVEGQLELLTISVPIQAALTFDETDGIEFAWDVRVDIDADWLAGDLQLIATAFGEERYRKAIAEWNGWHLSTTKLSDGAGEIFPGAPADCRPSQLQRRPEIADALTLAGSRDPFDAPTRAAIARGDTRDPTPQDLDELGRAFDLQTGDARRAAAYALGRAIGRVHAQQPASAAAAIDDLLGRFDPAAATDDQVLVLRAIGNAGTRDALDVVDLALTSLVPDVRRAAARALRHVPGSEADDRLREIMLGDRDRDVRVEAVRTAGARRTEVSNEAVAMVATDDADAWVQIAAVHALGRAVTRSDAAAEALREVAAHAELGQLRAVAANYLHRLEPPVPSIPH